MDQLRICQGILVICGLNVMSLPEYFLQPFCTAYIWHPMEMAMVFELCGQLELTISAKFNNSVKKYNS